MRIAQMNLVLEATRQEVIRSHSPGDNDLYHYLRWSWDRYRKVIFSATQSTTIWTVSFRIFVRAHVANRTTADPQPTFTEVKEKTDRAMQLGSNEERIIHEFATRCRFPSTRLLPRISRRLCGY